MSVAVRIDTAKRTIFFDFEGSITDQEFSDAVRAAWSDPEYRPEYSRLFDATEAVPARLSGEMVRWAAVQDSAGHIGLTALVAHADAMYGMMRMYQICSERHCEVFRTRTQALEWLSQEAEEPAVDFGLSLAMPAGPLPA
jgi:hypothetical protein